MPEPSRGPDAERRIRAVLETLAGTYGWRVLPDIPAGDGTAAGFLVQVDDYELRVVVEAPQEARPKLSLEQLKTYLALLYRHPATVAVVAVWPLPQLPALTLRPDRLAYLQGRPALLLDEVARARPLEATLRSFIEGQTKDWGASALGQVDSRAAVRSDTRALFEQALRQRLNQERNRPYRLEEKLAAARELSERDVAVILKVLDLALSGEQAKDLAARLVSPAEGRRP